MVTPRGSSHYPNMKIRILWAFLECLCFSGLTGGWDLLFRTFSEKNLIFFGNVGNISDTISTNCTTSGSGVPDTNTGNTPVGGGRKNLSYVCEDDISTTGKKVVSSRVALAITCLVYMFLTVPLGALYDRYGTLKTRFIAM